MLTIFMGQAWAGLVDQGFVLEPPDVGYGALGVNAPALDFDPGSGRFVMVSEVIDSDLPDKDGCCQRTSIAVSTSANMIDWDLSPLLGPEALGVCGLGQPGLLIQDGQWRLTFTVADAPDEGCGNNQTLGIRQATSVDGVAWVVEDGWIAQGGAVGHSSPILLDQKLVIPFTDVPDIYVSVDGDQSLAVAAGASDWSVDRVFGGSVACGFGGSLEMVFAGRDDAGHNTLGKATSADGLSWFVDLGDPLVADFDLGALNHWEWVGFDDGAFGSRALLYAKDHPTLKKKAIGLALDGDVSDPRSRQCLGFAEDLGEDSGVGPDTGVDRAVPEQGAGPEGRGQAPARPSRFWGCAHSQVNPSPWLLIGALAVALRSLDRARHI